MSKIQWTGRTWNPTTGCDRVSPGCDNCYALTMAARLKGMGQPKYQNDGDPRTSGPGFALTVHTDALTIPMRVKKPTTWFVNSMSDLYHKDVPAWFIGEVYDVMRNCPQHTFQILTKRPQRAEGIHPGLDYRYGDEWRPLPNVWLGTSIENDRYTFRANHLRNTLAAIRFLSCEPLLGPLPSLDLTGIDWVIIGGESGRGARRMDLAWARDIIAKARAEGAAVFVKQLGSVWARGLADSKGGDPDAWPDDLRVREMPRSRSARAEGTVA